MGKVIIKSDKLGTGVGLGARGAAMAKQRTRHARRLQQALADHGHRFTRQRARVYEVLVGTDQHPTTEEIHRKVRQTMPAVSLATVYKSLDALVRCGLASKLAYGDDSARYDANVSDHPHMRDLATGRVLDVPADLADKVHPVLPRAAIDELLQRTGFRVTGLRVELLGHLNVNSPSP
jgi:Fur family peroxide stress response transcriptional regulator